MRSADVRRCLQAACSRHLWCALPEELEDMVVRDACESLDDADIDDSPYAPCSPWPPTTRCATMAGPWTRTTRAARPPTAASRAASRSLPLTTPSSRPRRCTGHRSSAAARREARCRPIGSCNG